MTFTYNDSDFLLDGQPYRILSGAVHYFRIVPEYWEDRLKKLKACGFNTVETYTCWNLHERKEGQFDFSGMLSVVNFGSHPTENFDNLKKFGHRGAADVRRVLVRLV